MPKTVAELSKQAAELTEEATLLRGRISQLLAVWRPGEPVPVEVSSAFDRLLRGGSELHDALDDLAALEGK